MIFVRVMFLRRMKNIFVILFILSFEVLFVEGLDKFGQDLFGYYLYMINKIIYCKKMYINSENVMKILELEYIFIWVYE